MAVTHGAKRMEVKTPVLTLSTQSRTVLRGFAFHGGDVFKTSRSTWSHAVTDCFACFAFHGGDVSKTSRSTRSHGLFCVASPSMGVTFSKRHSSPRSHGLFLVLRFINFVLNSQDLSLDLHALRPMRYRHALRPMHCSMHCSVRFASCATRKKYCCPNFSGQQYLHEIMCVRLSERYFHAAVAGVDHVDAVGQT